MIITRSVRVTQHVPDIYVCNGCGKHMPTTHKRGATYFDPHDLHEFEASGGWASTYPGDQASISFHLCGPCLQDVVARFAVPPTLREP